MIPVLSGADHPFILLEVFLASAPGQSRWNTSAGFYFLLLVRITFWREKEWVFTPQKQGQWSALRTKWCVLNPAKIAWGILIFKALQCWRWCWYSSAKSGFSHQLHVWCPIAAKLRALSMQNLLPAPSFFHSQVLLRWGVHVSCYSILFLAWCATEREPPEEEAITASVTGSGLLCTGAKYSGMKVGRKDVCTDV